MLTQGLRQQTVRQKVRKNRAEREGMDADVEGLRG